MYLKLNTTQITTFIFNGYTLPMLDQKHRKILFKVILTIVTPSQLKIITLYKGPEWFQ